MTMENIFVTVTQDAEHGVILRLSDVEVADQFEDFLTEKCYALFDVGFENNQSSFYFGRASSIVNVKSLFNDFIELTYPNKIIEYVQ